MNHLQLIFNSIARLSAVGTTMMVGLMTLAGVTSCNGESPTSAPIRIDHLAYFGFSLVDVGWDDPWDKESKTNYTDEVAAFSNIADVLAVNPTEDIVPRMRLVVEKGMKSVLHISEIFFTYSGAGGPSGSLYRLRPDYQGRWREFLRVNQLKSNYSMVQAFYVGEEPTWNSITYAELMSATDLIKATVPQVPILVIEAYPMVGDIEVPTSVDWLGFDHYFIRDPHHDTQFLNEFALIKAKRSTPSQKIVLILDAHYIQELHGDHAGLTEARMKDVATSYFNLAASDPDVVALIGYAWPGGFDAPNAKGARELPRSVRDEYERIGKLILRK